MKYPYQDSSLPVDERVRDLMYRMTLEEKVRQLNTRHATMHLLDKENLTWMQDKVDELIDDKGLGFMQHAQKTVEANIRLTNEMQRLVIERSRLGIPLAYLTETMHGFLSAGATIFPQSIGLASTFNPELVKKMASMIALEAGSSGAHLAMAPDLDIAQEPRWGRVEETYGEDPYLIGEMGSAYIKGLQGENYAIDRSHVGCTVKHYVAHGSPQGGLNIAPSSCGERQLRESYLKPFKKCIEECNPAAVMPCYSEFDGIPVHENEFLLTQVLRDEMGFEGIVLTDWEGIEFLQRYHCTADTMEEAGKHSLEAGVDVEAPRICCFSDKLVEMVRAGEVSEALVNRSVERVLRLKFRLGLFENPYIDESIPPKVVSCPEHVEFTRKVAHESIVLLKNENNMLPLKKNLKSIAVIGPNADVAQLGGYCVAKKTAVTPLEGIKNYIGSSCKIIYEKGCNLTGADRSGFDDAVAAAGKAEVALVLVGGASMVRSGLGWTEAPGTDICTCGEGFDRSDLDLPGVQQQLVEAVVATGTPTVVIMQNGRPQTIQWISENVPAIIEMWYAGEQLGNALADILFGDVNPSGRLPISFPKTVGQIPVYYNYKRSARGRVYKQPGTFDNPGRDYVFSDTKALYEFGHGLSYTTFEYSDLKVTPESILPGGTAIVMVNVKNTGKRAGYESVLMFICDVVSSVTTPIKMLKGFTKIWLEPGEQKAVTFKLSFNELSLFNARMKEVVEPGLFEVYVGDLTVSFKVM